MTEYKLQYAPWTSDIELAFYAALASLKINHDKLDDSARKVLGLYEIRPSDAPSRSARMQLHGSALTTDETTSGYLRAEGTIKNVNTIEEFRNLERRAIVERAGRMIWDAICDGTIYSCPSLLASFTAISFADLKKYKFTYHFAFPALATDNLWTMSTAPGSGHTKLGHKETTGLVDAVQTWKYGVDSRQHGFFLAKRLRHRTPEGEDRPETPKTPMTEELGFSWAVGSLSSYENDFFRDVQSEDQFVCFADPSTYPDVPAWMLRNLLVLIKYKWQLKMVQIMCYRDTHLRRDTANSIILTLSTSSTATMEDFKPTSQSRTSLMPKVIGWERNADGKMVSRLVDLAAYMDPQKLADQAVDLNLKLIKWRIAPSLDLDIIKNTKCLLLGAGTLGSYVSRNLMGWGVRKITFVDNATVSFSNPVRQPLFDFKDCLEGGAKKAWRASEVLQEIYPGVDSEGHVMTVPMAGHPITDENKTKADYETLSSLMDEHDAIFLLMDTRESRWLPTVMAKAKGKIVMNAALGFDTFVVMRQGLPANGPNEEELGCYFCNDVVAPADSLKDATLDQQCTVTRPGIAPMASALLVELLVSILQHPLQARAPADSSASSGAAQVQNSSTAASRTLFNHPLGLIPHTIRGYLSTFSHLVIKGKPYDCCSACSPKILDLYKKDGWDFVKRAINEKGWVEEISGLAEVQRKAEEAEKEMDFEFSDAEDDGEGELI
ncbi:autophagy-related protein 7 [Pseudovirgaria hyperparasitica]|uniref:Ubiquitin-like modifier-activating enzyme ATG7 n=1 Tax=Pseudovirgaria hyperparasitica TaxID=470096 RepID=A0A6A6WFW0_9PEZI|nr:autophagy-related protein 7 [Pseudovirgaria hyperparasitica]KAF2760021.1 autophagy-related protein 7 [Pseudovirgaria hyperparasitica]